MTLCASHSPVVTIVIPCWNGVEHVGNAVESALTQTYQHTEVIVVDDGSTDNSLDVIRSFGKRIRWESGPNQGAGAARNQGIRMGIGEYIQLLDADDILFPTKVQRQIDFLRASDSPLAYTDHLIRTTHEGPAVLRSESPPASDPVVFVLNHRALQTSATLYPRQWLIGVGGFRPDLSGSQEFDLNLRLAAWGTSLGAICPSPSSRCGAVRGVFLAISGELWHVWRTSCPNLSVPWSPLAA